MASLMGLLQQRWFVPLVIIGGLLLRCLIALYIPLEQGSDSAWYLSRAVGLAEGRGFEENGFPTAYWPVGWPLVLAGGLLLTHSANATILLLNLAAQATIMLMIVKFARLLLRRELVARIALLAYACYPNHIAYTGQAATELFYTALVMVAFYLLLASWIGPRAGRYQLPLSGLLFGLATLVKTQTLLFPLGAVVVICVAYKFNDVKQICARLLLFYCALALVVAPWSYRNWQVFDTFVLVSTNGGTALLMGANDQLTGDHFDYELTPVFSQLGIAWEERVERQVELDQVQKRVAKQWIADNLGSYLGWVPKKIALLWLKDTDGFWAYQRSYPASEDRIRLLQYANQLFYLAVLLLALLETLYILIGFCKGRGEERVKLVLLCMPVFVTLLAGVFTGQIRYHFPAMPFLFLLAADCLTLRFRQRGLAWCGSRFSKS